MLHRLDAQLVRVATAPVRAAESDAAAAQLVLDSLPQDGDVPPVFRFPPPSQLRSRLPPLAQLRGIRKSGGARLAVRSCSRPLPGVCGIDTALRVQREQLVAERDAAQALVRSVRGSVSVRSAVGFCDGWKRFRLLAARKAKRVERRTVAPSTQAAAVPRSVPHKSLSAAARRCAAVNARTRDAAERVSAVLLSVQPVLDRAASVLRYPAGVTQCTGGCGASGCRCCLWPLCDAVWFPTARRAVLASRPMATRAQVLSTVVQSRPLVAAVVMPGCGRVRPRPDARGGALVLMASVG